MGGDASEDVGEPGLRIKYLLLPHEILQSVKVRH
jgi:hypothetical protein